VGAPAWRAPQRPGAKTATPKRKSRRAWRERRAGLDGELQALLDNYLDRACKARTASEGKSAVITSAVLIGKLDQLNQHRGDGGVDQGNVDDEIERLVTGIERGSFEWLLRAGLIEAAG